MEKLYTLEDVQNIIRSEQERWDTMTKVSCIYSQHGKDRIIYNVLKQSQGINGMSIQIEV